MANNEELVKYHAFLCEKLNEANIKQKYDGIPGKEFDWKPNEFDPYTTFLGAICMDSRAFDYLDRMGYLKKGIC